MCLVVFLPFSFYVEEFRGMLTLAPPWRLAEFGNVSHSCSFLGFPLIVCCWPLEIIISPWLNHMSLRMCPFSLNFSFCGYNHGLFHFLGILLSLCTFQLLGHPLVNFWCCLSFLLWNRFISLYPNWPSGSHILRSPLSWLSFTISHRGPLSYPDWPSQVTQRQLPMYHLTLKTHSHFNSIFDSRMF